MIILFLDPAAFWQRVEPIVRYRKHVKGCVRTAEANPLEAEPGALESGGQQSWEAANTDPGPGVEKQRPQKGGQLQETQPGSQRERAGRLRRVLCHGDQERTCFKKEGHLCECPCEGKNRDVRVRCDIDRSSIWVKWGQNPTRVS